MTARGSAVASWGVLLGGIGVWWLVSHAGWVSRAFLPTPEATLASLWQGFSRGSWLADTWDTVLRTAGGWLLGGVAGVALGTLIGGSPRAQRWLGPTLEFWRPLPASAVLPLGTALFGLSPAMVLGVVALGAMWPVLLATVHGLSSVPPALRDVGRALALDRADVVRKIALPHALPDILAGLRLALSVALIVSVVGEMVAAQPGLGQNILLAARAYRSSELMAGIALLGALGLAGNTGLALVQRPLRRAHHPG